LFVYLEHVVKSLKCYCQIPKTKRFIDSDHAYHQSVYQGGISGGLQPQINEGRCELISRVEVGHILIFMKLSCNQTTGN